MTAQIIRFPFDRSIRAQMRANMKAAYDQAIEAREQARNELADQITVTTGTRQPAPHGIRRKSGGWLKVGDWVTCTQMPSFLRGHIVDVNIHTATKTIDRYLVEFGHIRSWKKPEDLRRFTPAGWPPQP